MYKQTSTVGVWWSIDTITLSHDYLRYIIIQDILFTTLFRVNYLIDSPSNERLPPMEGELKATSLVRLYFCLPPRTLSNLRQKNSLEISS